MARRKGSSPKRDRKSPEAAHYSHDEADLPLRPEVGTQAQFKKHKPPRDYRYDSSLSPALDWDAQNPAREQGEAALAEIIRGVARIQAEAEKTGVAPERQAELKEIGQQLLRSADALKALSRPFLNWTGKAERLSFDVPTLPLFVHERLSTRAIIETLTGHKKDRNLDFLQELFADPRHSLTDQVLRAYEYREGWVNRMILGDSLVVMNSLLRYEALGGQVQMIYMDPPYGVKFGSNFQPFVRKRDVSHGDDADMTREPEMVQAYRDTWELGLHSYLTYLRDRLLLARELLAPTGSIFVQISDENLHHVREVMDEVFGAENFVGIIPFRKKTMPLGAKHLESVTDYLVWAAKDASQMRFRPLFEKMSVEGDNHWNCVELPNGTRRKMSREEISNHKLLIEGGTPYQLVSLYPAGVNQTGLFPFTFNGRTYRPTPGNSWFTHERGMQRLADANRLEPYEDGETLRYVLKLSDSPVTRLTNLWSDTSAPSDKLYVVQTAQKIIQRCLLMTTDPGDLVLDPTCGSGTTAYVAEQWGRRWITCDTSRVPLALARQRLLTATFPFYEINAPVAADVRGHDSPSTKQSPSFPTPSAAEGLANNPANGFVYRRRQNSRGEEVGGIVPYISKGSIANNEPPAEEVVVDRPEEKKGITRVCGPFVVEASIPTAHGLDTEPETPGLQSETHADFSARLLEVLRKSPVLRLDGNRSVTFKNIRPPARTLVLGAEALQMNGEEKPVAFLFGPENGAVSERLVAEAAREAWGKNYARLYVIGFAIEAKARETVENCEAVFNVPATYVQATPDLLMGDLLKNMRSSQIFSVCGAPEVTVRPVKPAKSAIRYPQAEVEQWQVELLGLDVFDPVTMDVAHRAGADVPAWFLDTDYNGRVFHVTQAFFPRTGAWEGLKKALKGDYDETVWDHLAGTVSAPFPPGEHRQVAVKVIDDRGNELLVVRRLEVEK